MLHLENMVATVQEARSAIVIQPAELRTSAVNIDRPDEIRYVSWRLSRPSAIGARDRTFECSYRWGEKGPWYHGAPAADARGGKAQEQVSTPPTSIRLARCI
jgi:hypothetical protein